MTNDNYNLTIFSNSSNNVVALSYTINIQSFVNNTERIIGLENEINKQHTRIYSSNIVLLDIESKFEINNIIII